MPTARRHQISWLPGNYYHIYNRGARQKSIFLTEKNYVFCLREIKKYAQKYNLSLIAYCLMPNHYHFLVRQNSDAPAGKLAQYVFLNYTRSFNVINGSSGTLFEGRYQAKHVNEEPWLLYLCKYIHFNPVKDGIVSSPEAWRYSNYLEWIGKREGSLVDRSFVQEHFGGAAKYQQIMDSFLIERGFDTFD